MAERLFLSEHATRQEMYQSLYPQIETLLKNETDTLANLSNFVAVLKENFGFFWVGFYRVTARELILGPFQGSLACTRIAFDAGVCGFCYRTQKTVIVPDVEQFEGHIACSSLSKSEIVIPIFKNNKMVLILDVDSDKIDDFSLIDKVGLENLVRLIEQFCDFNENSM